MCSIADAMSDCAVPPCVEERHICIPAFLTWKGFDTIGLHAVEQTGKNTFFGRTATLLQSVENLGNLQKILMRVVIVLLVSPCLPCLIQRHVLRYCNRLDAHSLGS